MRYAALWAVGLVAWGVLPAEAGVVRVVVADLPYERVWEAAVRAVEGYPVERAGQGVIVTKRVERPPEPGEGPFERVAERVTLRLDAFGPRVTRVTVEVVAEGWRGGAWVPIADTEPRARAIVARLRAEQG